MINDSDLEAFGYYSGNYFDYAEYEEVKRLKTMTPLQMVREFAERMEQPLNVPMDELGGDLEGFRFSLISEEFEEVGDARTKEEMLKELADLIYVTYGYAATFGWDLDDAVRRVHKSNMSKLGDDGYPVKNEDGKVIKGPNYKKPNLADLV